MHSNFHYIAKICYDSENSSVANFGFTVHHFSIGSCCSISPYFIFLLFSALLSSRSLIYDVEFDSNSSCLDRLNNVGMISLQKLQNLPQNAISRIVGTLMCKSS